MYNSVESQELVVVATLIVFSSENSQSQRIGTTSRSPVPTVQGNTELGCTH